MSNADPSRENGVNISEWVDMSLIKLIDNGTWHRDAPCCLHFASLSPTNSPCLPRQFSIRVCQLLRQLPVKRYPTMLRTIDIHFPPACHVLPPYSDNFSQRNNQSYIAAQYTGHRLSDLFPRITPILNHHKTILSILSIHASPLRDFLNFVKK